MPQCIRVLRRFCDAGRAETGGSLENFKPIPAVLQRTGAYAPKKTQSNNTSDFNIIELVPQSIHSIQQQAGVFGRRLRKGLHAGRALGLYPQPAAWGVKSEAPKGVRLPNSWEREMGKPASANMASGSRRGD